MPRRKAIPPFRSNKITPSGPRRTIHLLATIILNSIDSAQYKHRGEALEQHQEQTSGNAETIASMRESNQILSAENTVLKKSNHEKENEIAKKNVELERQRQAKKIVRCHRAIHAFTNSPSKNSPVRGSSAPAEMTPQFLRAEEPSADSSSKRRRLAGSEEERTNLRSNRTSRRPHLWRYRSSERMEFNSSRPGSRS